MYRCTIYFLFCFSLGSLAAQVRITQNGFISFTSDAPLELIQAESEELQGALDTDNQTFAFSLRIEKLQGFNSELQREHFNEKFMESHTFPRATFQGKIIEKIDFQQEGTFEVRAKGVLNVHGVAQERIIRAKLTLYENECRIEARFKVLVADHNITIPQVVYQNIAQEVDVFVQAILVPKDE